MPDLIQELLSLPGKTDTRIYRGKLTAVDTLNGIASVQLPFGTITSLQWLAPYVPVVGDPVAVARDEVDWVVLGKLSTRTVPVSVTETITVAPDSVHLGDYRLYQVNGSGSPAWSWVNADPAKQGRTERSWKYEDPGVGYWDAVEMKWVWVVPPSTTNYYQRDDYGTLSKFTVPTLPSGSTINAAKLRVTRTDGAGGSPISPVVYGHTLSGTPAGALTAYLHASYGPWKPGTLAAGQTGRWDLPSGWIAAFMAGTVKGFGIWSDKAADYMEAAAPTLTELAITYTYTP